MKSKILSLVLMLALFGCSADESLPENGDTSELVEKSYTIDELYEDVSLVGEEVSVIGILPQAMISDEEGNQLVVMWNEEQDQYLILEGKIVNIGNCKAELKGSLSERGDKLVLEVVSFSEIKE